MILNAYSPSKSLRRQRSVVAEPCQKRDSVLTIMTEVGFWCVIAIIGGVIISVISQFNSDSIIFVDDDNEPGSSCIRQSDGRLGICSRIGDCQEFKRRYIVDHCNIRDQTVCCSLADLYNSIDTRFGEDDPPKSNMNISANALIGELVNDGRKMVWRCAGSLIAPRFILTSAHCLHHITPPAFVRITTDGLEMAQVKAGDATVDRIFIHPAYYRTPKYHNDIAIVSVKKAVEGFHPFQLPKEDINFNNETLITSGWFNTNITNGENEDLKFLSENITIVSHDQCVKTGNHSHEIKPGRFDHHWCGARVENSTLDPCSALFGSVETTKNILIGLQSFGFGCDEEDHPILFTNIASFVPWIKSVIYSS
ncbi:hypothetical protein DMENIID0001_016680 [Sergentomyia squamirostris]